MAAPAPSASPAGTNVGTILKQIDQGHPLSDTQVEFLLDAGKRNPKDATIPYALGRYYESVNFGTLAAEQYWASYVIDQNNPDPLIAMARVKLKLGDLPAASDLVNRAYAKFPNNYKVLVTRGLFYQREGNMNRAVECYKAAAKLQPADAELLSASAQLFFKEASYREALRMANKALELDPSSSVALATRGQCLSVMGQPSLALKPLAQAFTGSPYNFELAKFYYATSMRVGRSDLAIAPAMILMAAYVGKPDHLLLFKNRIMQMILTLPDQKVQAAAVMSEKKLDGTKMANLVYFCLGDIYDRLGQPNHAIKYYQGGLKTDPNYARAYLRVGMDQEDYLGDYGEAMKNYKTAFTLLPDDFEIKARMDRLQSRMDNQHNDLAWKLKSVFKKARPPQA